MGTADCLDSFFRVRRGQDYEQKSSFHINKKVYNYLKSDQWCWFFGSRVLQRSQGENGWCWGGRGWCGSLDAVPSGPAYPHTPPGSLLPARSERCFSARIRFSRQRKLESWFRVCSSSLLFQPFFFYQIKQKRRERWQWEREREQAWEREGSFSFLDGIGGAREERDGRNFISKSIT